MSASSPGPDPEKGVQRDGYPSLAAWIAHDPDNESYVFRKFDKLSARNLLGMQSQLISLEMKIESIEDAMRNSGDPENLVSLARWETYEERAKDPKTLEYQKMKTEENLKNRIKEYHEALLLQSNICKLDGPSNRVLGLYRNLFKQPNNIVSGNARFVLDDTKDLAAICPPLDTDPLSRLLRDHWPFKGTPYPDPRDTTQHFLESRVKWAVLVITTVLAAILLIGAIAGLYFLERPESKLGMIAGLTTLFAAGVGCLTSAKRHEIFAASAAYAAVLVVFVSGDFDKKTG